MELMKGMMFQQEAVISHLRNAEQGVRSEYQVGECYNVFFEDCHLPINTRQFFEGTNTLSLWLELLSQNYHVII